MSECIVCALVLLCFLPAPSENPPPAGWKVIKDSKGLCQITVPPDWVPLSQSSGAAVLHDPSTAIAVVTSQPGQEFKPLNPTLLKNFRIPSEKMFENSASRIFYQDKISRQPSETSGFSSSVPARNGTCSCHVAVLPSVPDDVAKKIALSISPVPTPQ